jgi:hypothetical protein
MEEYTAFSFLSLLLYSPFLLRCWLVSFGKGWMVRFILYELVESNKQASKLAMQSTEFPEQKESLEDTALHIVYYIPLLLLPLFTLLLLCYNTNFPFLPIAFCYLIRSSVHIADLQFTFYCTAQ